MTTDSLAALRRANPRAKPGFGESLAATEWIREDVPRRDPRGGAVAAARRGPARGRGLGLAAGAGLAGAAVAVALLTVGSPGDGPAVRSASAAVAAAADATAASAQDSGTAEVRITHDGRPWAGTTIRWSGQDISSFEGPERQYRVVDGTLYGIERGVGAGWIDMGSPDSIDPGSGTTPAELLAATRGDLGGATLRRIGAGSTDLVASPGPSGSTTYAGTVAAGLVATESGVKEGRAIRVLPYGYVANGEAANPASPLRVAFTVGADGLVHRLRVTWGSPASAWTYTVSFRDLGRTPAPAVPSGARPFPDRSVPGS
jgi:hypothetical protein